MLIDEATSNVDNKTDKYIQNILRNHPKFDKITILCIAHRLKTIIDYDYVITIKNGKICEYDTPKKL